jgi:hypothetical protein
MVAIKLKRPDREVAKARLLQDQGGATMVMGVFIAVLLVGMIYYVWGIGDAIMHRERMQDASDTAAFSAAVIHARGMNMLALINMISAALAMVAATMAVIAQMIMYAAAAASLVCLGCGPWCASCCNACPYAVRHWAEYDSADSMSDRVSDLVEQARRGLHMYAQGIRSGVPLAAQAKVVSYGTDVYSPVTDVGIMAPPLRTSLPVQDDETNWPCDNKVLPVVRVSSPVLVWIWGSSSLYMLGGVAAGELDARRITRQWCDDGYFQRVTDNAQEMGNPEYQVQAYMIGSPDLEWTQTGVAVATWGEGDSAGSTYANLAEMSRISFAQGEFFYDDWEDDWHEWMWHMNWRARLRRWRMSGAGAGGMTGVCEGNPACGPLNELGGSLDSAVVH